MTTLPIDYETDKYALGVDRFGHYELTRKSDGKSAYFQGDDADILTRTMRAICQVHSLYAARDRSFNTLCDGYDNILT